VELSESIALVRSQALYLVEAATTMSTWSEIVVQEELKRREELRGRVSSRVAFESPFFGGG
jgi:hypothetical protein